MNDPIEEILVREVKRALDNEIRRISEEEAHAAASRTMERIREYAGSIATKVANYVSFERFGTEIRITVQFPNK